MTDHTDLVRRLKAATGPSEELDADIAEALGVFEGTRREHNTFWEDFEDYAGRIGHRALRYTSSIDAVLGTARSTGEQMAMLHAAYWEAEERRDVDSKKPPTPVFEFCCAAILVRLGGE